jgi:hypothetical protein
MCVLEKPTVWIFLRSLLKAALSALSMIIINYGHCKAKGIDHQGRDFPTNGIF